MDVSGVAFSPPPPSLLEDAHAALQQALGTLPPGAQGALVGVATASGVNAVVVAKAPHEWAVQAWIGKTWTGPITGGASVLKVW